MNGEYLHPQPQRESGRGAESKRIQRAAFDRRGNYEARAVRLIRVNFSSPCLVGKMA